MSAAYRRDHAGAFEVVFEGVEARHRDPVAKREEYRDFGLIESRIIDRFDKTVTVLARRGDAWDEPTFTGPAAAQGLVLPGFAVRTDDLWAAAMDRDEPTA